MRSLVTCLCLGVALAGCRGASPRPTSGERAPAPVQLRTAVSLDASTIERIRLVSDAPPVPAQMALVRALAVRADDRFLATVKDRLPFRVTKKPWLDRPCIELSLRELLIRHAPTADAPDRVRVQVGLKAELPELGVSLDRTITYERELAAPLARGTAEAGLAPAVEEAAALAAGWLVEATSPPAPEAADEVEDGGAGR